MRPARIVDLVFSAGATPAQRGAVVVAIGLSLAAHGLLGWVASAVDRLAPSPAPPGPPIVVEAAPPPTPPPPPPVKQEEPSAAPVRANAPSAAPPEAAQAAQLAGQTDPETDEAPLDLSGIPFVTGTAKSYGGGFTQRDGTSDRPVLAQAAPRPAPTPHAGAPDRSRPVSLEESDWNCAWPREAEEAEIDQVSVLLRATVEPDGHASAVSIESDPGHGFGAAALACARRSHFSPARDRSDHPIRADSPLIRVHFTR